MTPEQREKLISILVELSEDQLRALAYTLSGEDVYRTKLQGSSKLGKVTDLLSRVESTGQVEELIETAQRQHPDIDFSEVISELVSSDADVASEKDVRVEAGSAPAPEARSYPPEFADRMRHRRPGYDKVFQLVQQFNALSPDQRRGMTREDLIEIYVRPMFQALGWHVQKEVGGGGMRIPMTIPTAIPPATTLLILSSHDTRVLVWTASHEDPDESQVDNDLLQLLSRFDVQWGIVTNFDFIRIWDARDAERPQMILETSPRLYIVDSNEDDDLLAAEWFYDRLVERQPAPPARTLAPEEASPVEPAPEDTTIATRLLSDRFSDVDLLDFLDYAQAIADFIKNEKTEKPLTIGIDAAWGMGKTTLMHMIKCQLTQQDESRDGTRSFPTVWFNAWKYDQEESLWAALALQILREAREGSTFLDQVRLFVQLNRSRFDGQHLLQRVITILAYVAAVAILGGLVIGSAVLAVGSAISLHLLVGYAKAVGVLGLLAAVYAAGTEVHQRIAGPFDLKISDFVREPNYKDRVGFLGQFEQDFARVVRVVTEDGKWPLVVFIDDLDRCAPPKPAEIIEAINILLDAKHCVYVIGMDAQSTAASIEAKYSDLKADLGSADYPGGLTLGQRFLEKIFQITFRIPRPAPHTLDSFIDATIGALRESAPALPSEADLMEAEELIKAEQRIGRLLDEAAQAVQAMRPDLPERLIAEAREEIFAKSFEDTPEVKDAVHNAAEHLAGNPRKIKRFINTFRLQALIANRRGLLQSGDIDLGLLAKSAVITMRWPAFLDATATNPDFTRHLLEAHDAQQELRQAQQTGATEEERASLQDQLNVRLADPHITQLLGATDLLALLGEMTDDQITSLPQHLSLAQTTTPQDIDQTEANNG